MNVMYLLELIDEERSVYFSRTSDSDKHRHYVLDQLFKVLLKHASHDSNISENDILYTLSQLPVSAEKSLKDVYSYLAFPEQGSLVFDLPESCIAFEHVSFNAGKEKRDLILEIAIKLLKKSENWKHQVKGKELRKQNCFSTWLKQLSQKDPTPNITVNGVTLSAEEKKADQITHYLSDSRLTAEGKVAAMKFLSKVSDRKMLKLIDLYLSEHFNEQVSLASRYGTVNWGYDEMGNPCCIMETKLFFLNDMLPSKQEKQVNHTPILINDNIVDEKDPDLEVKCSIVLAFDEDKLATEVEQLIVSGKTASVKPLLASK